MGKITGFLEIDRQELKYAPAADRVRHFREFIIPMDRTSTERQAARCMDCGIPFCHTGCPVNNQIPDWNDLIYTGNWHEAARNLPPTISRKSPAASAPLPARRPAPSTLKARPSPSRPSRAPSPTAPGRKAG
jgi:hypothetical protein